MKGERMREKRKEGKNERERKGKRKKERNRISCHAANEQIT